jgi:stage II sporulation protein AA (anti-sigma F factor antagonist)
VSVVPEALTIDVVHATSGVVLALAGDLDLSTAGDLVAAAEDVLAESGPSQELVLDLGGVVFCDSAGISAMVTVRRLSTQYGCALRVTKAQPQVRRVLELTGLTAHLNLA